MICCKSQLAVDDAFTLHDSWPSVGASGSKVFWLSSAYCSTLVILPWTLFCCDITLLFFILLLKPIIWRFVQYRHLKFLRNSLHAQANRVSSPNQTKVWKHDCGLDYLNPDWKHSYRMALFVSSDFWYQKKFIFILDMTEYLLGIIQRVKHHN